MLLPGITRPPKAKKEEVKSTRRLTRVALIEKGHKDRLYKTFLRLYMCVYSEKVGS